MSIFITRYSHNLDKHLPWGHRASALVLEGRPKLRQSVLVRIGSTLPPSSRAWLRAHCGPGATLWRPGTAAHVFRVSPLFGRGRAAHHAHA